MSTTIGLISDYAIQKYRYQTLAIAEVLGAVGGLFSLYVKITKFLGRILLNYLYKRKKMEKEKLLQKINNVNYQVLEI